MLTPSLSLPTITQEIALNTIRYNRSLGVLENSITRLARRMANVGVSMALAVSIPLQLMAGAAIRHYAELEAAALSAVSKVTGANRQMVDDLVKFSQGVSFRIPLSAVEITGGIDELIKTGANLPFAQAMIERFSEFAVVGGMQVTEAINRVTSTFFGLGMQTGKTVEDIEGLNLTMNTIHKVADITKADLNTMTDAFVSAAPAAKRYGLQLDELAAILGSYHQAGIAGAKAGTFLDMMVRDISRASTTEKFKKAWDDLNVKVFQGGQMRPMDQIIGDLQRALTSFTPEARAQVLKSLGMPERSIRATASLFGLEGSIKGVQEELKNLGDYTHQQFKFRMQGLGMQLSILRNRFNAAAYQLGAAFLPTLKSAMTWVEGLIDSFSKLSQEQMTSIVKWSLIASGMSLALIFTSMMIRSIYSLGLAFKWLWMATKGKALTDFLLGVGGAAMSGKIWTAIPWILTAWTFNLKKFQNWIGKLSMGAGLSKIGTFFSSILSNIQSLIPAVTLFGRTFFNVFVSVLGPIGSVLASLYLLSDLIDSLGAPSKWKWLDQLKFDNWPLIGDWHKELNRRSSEYYKNIMHGDQPYSPVKATGQSFKEALEQSMYNPMIDAKTKRDMLGMALEMGDISKEYYRQQMDFLDSASGFMPGSMDEAGNKMFEGFNKNKVGRNVKLQPFEAKERGTVEEFRSRVSGQSALINSTSSMASDIRGVRAATERNERNTRKTNELLERELGNTQDARIR